MLLLHWLQSAGLGPGDKIGVIGQNCIEWMVALQVGSGYEL
jgi:long-subunit acyl-CoA synthetase (AMP-forming)